MKRRYRVGVTKRYRCKLNTTFVREVARYSCWVEDNGLEGCGKEEKIIGPNGHKI